jgi:hypothetical protein
VVVVIRDRSGEFVWTVGSTRPTGNARMMMSRCQMASTGRPVPWAPGCVNLAHRARLTRTAPAAAPGRARGAVHALCMDMHSKVVPVVAPPRIRGRGTAGVDRERIDEFNFPSSLTFGVELEMALGSYGGLMEAKVHHTLAEAGLKGWT